MSAAPPDWYRDPTARFGVRYWDGAHWTEHVASPGVQTVDPLVVLASESVGAGRRRPPRLLGWAGLLLGLAAALAVAVPGIGYARALSHPSVGLSQGVQQVVLPAHQAYGIYITDANNSGYTMSCSATDLSNGRQVAMNDPSLTFGGSETESLDLVFETGSGRLSIDCSVPGEQISARPVPNAVAMLLGVLLGGLLGCAGAVLLIAWAVTRGRSHFPSGPSRSTVEDVQTSEVSSR